MPRPRVRNWDGFKRFFAHLEETKLKGPLRAITKHHDTFIFDIYTDVNMENVRAARIEAWWYLVAETGRTVKQVAELFDRTPRAIAQALQLLENRAEAMTVAVAADTVAVLARQAVSPPRKPKARHNAIVRQDGHER